MSAHRNDWRVTTVLFAVTGFVESLAFGHLGAFMPLFLQDLGVPTRAVAGWTGLLQSAAFVFGLPLLPFWGVWADRYGRKLIIIRSSIAGALMFALVASSTSVWMLACARLVGGFVLGNTGVMMIVQADITPRDRLARTVAIISAGSPLGMALGPFVGGLLAQAYGIRALLYTDALLTVAVALLLAAALREEPGMRTTQVGALRGVSAALRAVWKTPPVVRLFAATFVVSCGMSASHPYVPLLIQSLYQGPELKRLIGDVLTLSGIAMAVGTPMLGVLGDRAGYLRLWRVCAALVGVTLVAHQYAGSLVTLAAARCAYGICQGGLGALTTVLLTHYAPSERRTPILTLSLLPNQLSWFAGPLLGSALAGHSLMLPFAFGGACAALAVGASLGLPSTSSAAGQGMGRRAPYG